MARARFALGMVVALLGSGCSQDGERHEVVVTDRGAVSISPGGGAGAEAEVEVDVLFDHCLGRTCESVVSASCTAELRGAELVVTSEAVISHREGGCSADCGVVRAHCTAVLEPGTYRVVHGEDEATVTTPLDGMTRVLDKYRDCR